MHDQSNGWARIFHANFINYVSQKATKVTVKSFLNGSCLLIFNSLARYYEKESTSSPFSGSLGEIFGNFFLQKPKNLINVQFCSIPAQSF